MTPERIQRFGKVLELDAEQTKAAEGLYEEYGKNVTRTQKQMREDLHRAQEDMQDGDKEAIHSVTTTFRENSETRGSLLRTGRSRFQATSDVYSPKRRRICR